MNTDAQKLKLLHELDMYIFIVVLDLYVKLYVVNVATQKKIIKKKTRVCRHDREPSFNETFRFNLNPVGHSIQVTFPICLHFTSFTSCDVSLILILSLSFASS